MNSTPLRLLTHFRALVAACLCLGPVLRPASAFPAGTPVSPYVVGQNYWYFPPDSAYPVIMDSGVTLIRIGGHAFDVTPLSNADLLHQIDNIRAIGAEPIVQVSRMGDPATLAAAAAATVNFVNVVNQRHVRFWSIGNEPDLNYSGTETDLAAYVATYIKAIAPAMRDVDPSITILGPEMAWYSSTKFSALLGGASDISGVDSQGRYYVDCITFHRYPFGSTLTRSGVLGEMHSGFEGIVNSLLTRVAAANALHNRTGASALRWGLTEFNMTYSNPSGNTAAGLGVASFLNGQYFAEYYRTGSKYGALMMNTWSMLEGGGNGSGGDLGYLGGNWSAPVKRSSYYHLQMAADYMLPGSCLPATSDASTLAVWSTVTSAGDLAVMLLNEDSAGNRTFTLRMNSDAVSGPGTAVHVPADLPVAFTGTMSNQSTAVLIFDATGALRKRVSYSLTDNLGNAGPTVEIFAPATSLPSAPTGLTANSGDGQVTLTWSGSTAATGYNVKRAPASGGPYVTIAPGVMGTRFTDTGLVNGTAYYYVVAAVNAAGESADTPEVGCTPVAAPAGVSFEAENLALTVSGSTTSVNPDSGASGGKWVQLNSGAPGPYVEFTTGNVPAGSYLLKLTYKSNNNRGQLRFAVDGSVVGGVIDEYATAVNWVTTTVGTVAFPVAGVHQLRLTTVGRNAASTGYLISADKFSFGGATAASISFANQSQTYDGTPKPVAITTNPSGISYSVTYNGSPAAPTAAGVYAVAAQITDPAYYGSASTALVIAKAPATIALGNLAVEYNGAPQFATATTTPAGLAVNVLYEGGTIAAPVDAGSYAVNATIADANYQGSAAGTLVIRPAVATLTIGNLQASYDGTPKPVTVTTDPAGLTTSVTYDGSPNAPSAVGIYAVAVDVAERNYTGHATATLTIADTTPPVVTVPGAILIDADTALGAVANFSASAVDDVSGAVGVTYSKAPGSLFPTGTTVVTVSAVDAAGNVGTATFTVTVRAPAAAMVNHLALAGAVEGSVRLLTAEPTMLDGRSAITGELVVIGSPSVTLNGTPNFGGSADGSGNVAPADYTITLNGNATLGRLVRRMDAVAIPVVAAPAVPPGSRRVIVNKASDVPTDWTSVKDITLNGNAGAIHLPAGVYGAVAANGGSSVVVGEAGGTTPVVYELESLALNGGASLRVLGPVTIIVRDRVVANGLLGEADHPEWLDLRIAAGDLTLNGGANVSGYVTAPNGAVTLGGGSTVVGGVTADRLVVQGGARLTLRRSAR